MDALVGLELLKKDRQSKYSLGPESQAFLISKTTGALAAHSGNKTVKWRNTNLLFIRTSKCFDLRDENENEVALRNKSPAYREKF